MTIATARELAREAITRVRAGLPAVEPKNESFGNVASNWLTRHVERNGLRSRDEIVRLLDRHILPAWRNREFVSIRRSDITALLDKVEDGSGARQADYCLNIVRSVMNWYAVAPRRLQSADRARHAPAVPHAQARTRILTDDEIRAIWQAAETDGTFGALVRFALLTAQRREKSAPCGGTTFRTRASGRFRREPREKETGGVLVLPDAARADHPGAAPARRQSICLRGPRRRAVQRFRQEQGAPRRQAAGRHRGWTVHDLRRTGTRR